MKVCRNGVPKGWVLINYGKVCKGDILRDFIDPKVIEYAKECIGYTIKKVAQDIEMLVFRKIKSRRSNH
jgi:hypothetical protein